MEIKFDPDPINSNRNNNNKANHGSDSDSILMVLKISELEQELKQLRQEKDTLTALLSNAEVEKFVAFQESERCKRDCSRFQDAVFRLEEDCSILRERDLKGQEMIRRLVDEMEGKSREFTEKYVELTTAINDLECGKKRALKEADEWKNKCRELQAGVFRGRESANGSGQPLHDEMPRTRLGSAEKRFGSMENLELTRGLQMQCDLVVIDGDSDDEEDHITLSQLGKKRSAEGTEKAFSSSQCHPSSARAFASLESGDKEEDTCEVPNFGHQSFLKRNMNTQRASRECTGRMDAFDQQRLRANLKALKLQSSLNSKHPSFVKSMCRTNVSRCFTLSLPKKFCKQNIPSHELKMVLEDVEGAKYGIIVSGGHNRLTRIGWKDFVEEHNLKFGDALVFELSEPRRFKVYIIRARLQKENEDFDDEIAEERVASAKRGKTNGPVRRRILYGDT